MKFDYLYIKDEGLNPTGSFKARGLCMAISKAKELGITSVSIPSAGNAAGAMSAYAALGGMEAHVPEGGAALAAFIHLRKQGWIKDQETVVLFNTGSGHKYSHLWNPMAWGTD